MHTIFISHTNLLKRGTGWEQSFHSCVTEVSFFARQSVTSKHQDIIIQWQSDTSQNNGVQGLGHLVIWHVFIVTACDSSWTDNLCNMQRETSWWMSWKCKWSKQTGSDWQHLSDKIMTLHVTSIYRTCMWCSLKRMWCKTDRTANTMKQTVLFV